MTDQEQQQDQEQSQKQGQDQAQPRASEQPQPKNEHGQRSRGQQQDPKGQMSKGSIYAIVAVLAIALVVSLGFQIANNRAVQDALAVKVTQNGEVVAALPLDTDIRQEFVCDEGVNTVVVEAGGVHIEDADCKGGDCMKQGTISQQGQLLVCLPHRLIVEIVPAQRSEFQAPSVYTGAEAVGADGLDTVAR